MLTAAGVSPNSRAAALKLPEAAWVEKKLRSDGWNRAKTVARVIANRFWYAWVTGKAGGGTALL